ncbi:secretin N-terminal domain-containing protein [Methylophilus medardicus]|uniref:Type II secretion system protein GspD n=1 Tax=Methylophilus medardicus TaxID=2588534 RepID=A0A5B8CTW5_9PROT|nr:secretin N-terminal domain-containing protein [Methylophilus medardicus]QDC44693.1 type II secretion system protein GspD [Methylophilus medardicus]QDC49700.1 type II secretion system protein GspD [Methylophilus medardicus]QDC53405.1 type II secretion system protein GspD [Methylophilus medardicus]
MKALHLNAMLPRGLTLGLLAMGLSACGLFPPKMTATTPEGKVHELAQQVAEHPADVVLRNRWFREREQAINALSAEAVAADAKGDIAAAKQLYSRILTLDPNEIKALDYERASTREIMLRKQLAQAKQHMDNPKQALREVRDILLEQPTNQEAQALEKQLTAMEPRARAPLPQLQSQLTKPVTLELRDANIKVVFEALSRATGVNFVLDKDIKPETKASVFVKKMLIEDAIDMVITSNGLQKKVLSPTSVLVYPATQQKTKDYQDLLIRNFYFANTSAKQCADMLRTILKIRDVYVDERLNMLVIRDKPEVLTLAEKMIKAQDIADPEVMLEIEVIEITRNKLKQLGIGYPTSLTVLNNPLTLETIQQIKSGTIGIGPAPNVQFKTTDSDLNLLSNPRIRVKNNEKAKVIVGNKVPVITTNAIQGGVTSESVSYVDVGLKLDVEPKVMLDDYISIKVALEVSSLGEAVTLSNNSKVFNIGTRNASTVLRLKHGETQILAGLIQDSERKNAIKVPGLGEIPLLGRLFSNNTDEKNKTEIVLAITPKIISNVTLPEATYSEYWSGTDSVISDKPLLNNPTSPATPSRSQQIRDLQLQRQRELNEGGNVQATDPSAVDPAESAPVENAPINEPTGIPSPDTAPANAGASVAPASAPGGLTNNISVVPDQSTTSLPAPKEIR